MNRFDPAQYVPGTDLRRFVETPVTETSEGKVEGYGCTFGVVDTYNTRFAKGCFTASIAKWRTMARNCPMYVNHSDDRPVGGWMSLAEDDTGLRVGGEIVTTEREWIGGLFRMSVVTGMSIGFVPMAWVVESDGSVTFTEVSLREISLVTANSVPGSLIDSIRSAGHLPTTKREFEHLLRQIGFSSNAAKSITAAGFKEAELRDEAAKTENADLRDGADSSEALLRGLDNQLFIMRLTNG